MWEFILEWESNDIIWEDANSGHSFFFFSLYFFSRSVNSSSVERVESWLRIQKGVSMRHIDWKTALKPPQDNIQTFLKCF